MEPLFEALYTYASQHLYLPSEELEEQEQCEKMARHALEKLTAQGCGDQAKRMEDGLESMFWFYQRSFFRAGLSIGLELSRF